LTVLIDEDRITAALVDSVYSGNKGEGVMRWISDADRVAVSRDARAADVDVVAA
jgi:hypothetical protein